MITKTSNPATSPSTVYYNYDGAGNVTMLTDGSGNVLEQYNYDVYGAPTIKNSIGTVLTASAYGNRYLYAGREYEATTALYHYRNREYCPALGRFLQPDPIGHAGDANNLYRFCGNNPVSNGDPSGLDDADGGNFSAGGSGDYGGITTGNSGGSGFGSSGVTISLGSDDPGLPGFSNLSGSFSGGFSDIGIPTESQNNVSLPHVSSTGLDDWNASVNHLAFTPIVGTPASPASGAATVIPGASAANRVSGPFGVDVREQPVAMAILDFFILPWLDDIHGANSPKGAANLAVTIGMMGMGAEGDGLRAAEGTGKITTVLGSGRDVAQFAGRKGFNVLDMSTVPEAEWARTNAEWLNQALRRGDDIWLVTNPATHTALMQSLGKSSYYLDLELPMLEQFSAKAAVKY